MVSDKPSDHPPVSPSRRRFLKRSGVVLLPYVVPVIESMAIHVGDAEAKRRGRGHSPHHRHHHKVTPKHHHHHHGSPPTPTEPPSPSKML